MPVRSDLHLALEEPSLEGCRGQIFPLGISADARISLVTRCARARRILGFTSARTHLVGQLSMTTEPKSFDAASASMVSPTRWSETCEVTARIKEHGTTSYLKYSRVMQLFKGGDT